MEKLSDDTLEIIVSDPWTCGQAEASNIASDLLSTRKELAELKQAKLKDHKFILIFNELTGKMKMGYYVNDVLQWESTKENENGTDK